MFRSRLCLIVVLAILVKVSGRTAVLKGHLLLTSPFADILSGTPLPLLWLATFAELAVITVILSRLPLETQWLITSTFFLCLAAVSRYNVLSGKPSCGCAGALDIHPAWFLEFNLLTVLGIGGFQPSLAGLRHRLFEARFECLPHPKIQRLSSMISSVANYPRIPTCS